MAKKKVLKKRRVPAQKKPQPLPKSVQALVRYLSGTDVKLSSSARQPATIAQPFPQQAGQGQPQQQQAQPRRQQPTGQIIGSSPLSRLAPPPPAPQMTASQQPTQIVIKQSKEGQPSASELSLVKSKIGGLEQSLTQFKQQAGMVAVQLSEGIRKANKHYQNQDYEPLDSEIEFTPSSKPFVEEQKLLVSTESTPASKRSISAPTRAAYEPKEIDVGQSSYSASQYIQAVASPEMTPIVKLRGRPRLTEQQKLANAEARKQEKAQKAELLKQAGQQLYEGPSAIKALETLTSSIQAKKAEKPKLKLKLKSQSLVGLDPSTQIEQLASAGGASAKSISPQRGMSIPELAKK